MNIAIIFAGGTGQRMNTRTKPKQFLELHGKPILVYTIEQFQNHKLIDEIILVSLEDWIDYCEELIDKYKLTKVNTIVPGGRNGQESIYHGLRKAKELYDKDTIVLIHDGVRPLIDQETITKNINSVKLNGSAITVIPATETIIMTGESGQVETIIDRSKCRMARAPQSFWLLDIVQAHERAIKENKTSFIDSVSLMQFYGFKLYPIEGSIENIKITTPLDFYTFKSIIDARENFQILGI
ncbi:MAG: 2-C-methyl-D-erythritol 4-phosphate cytidylyltransferase [Lachnospiraceae bacterium]|nr:2-C-methyl-D-erythritol 4-phosphate cytidylyltransferase [Lachnospiraceae bacterium]